MKSTSKTAKDITPGAQPQAGAGGPVKTGGAPSSAQGSAAAHAASIINAHQTETAPSSNMSKAVGHMGRTGR